MAGRIDFILDMAGQYAVSAAWSTCFVFVHIKICLTLFIGLLQRCQPHGVSVAANVIHTVYITLNTIVGNR